MKQNKDKRNKRIFFVFILFGLLYIFNEEWYSIYTINKPLFIFIFEVFISVIWAINNYKNSILNSFSLAKYGLLKTSIFIASICIEVFRLYIILGSIVNLSFSLSNQYYAKQNYIEQYDLKITNAYTGTRKSTACIWYTFQGKELTFFNDSKVIKKIAKDKTLLKNATFKIKTRKGLFNSYIIQEWTIIF